MAVIKPLPDTSDIALVHLTPVGMIVAVNRGFGNLFGHDTAAIIGKQVGCCVLEAASRDRLSGCPCQQPPLRAACCQRNSQSSISGHLRLWSSEGLLISA